MALPIFTLALIGLGLLALIAGGLITLISAFRESILWGLIVIFAPFGNLIFTCCHWGRARIGFLTTIAGAAMIAGGVLTTSNFGDQIAQGLNERFPGHDFKFVEKPKAPPVEDLNSQIAEKRKALEDLQAAFAHAGRDLPAKYQQLEQRRKSLKADDQAAITKFNEEAAVYQAQNQHLKVMQQQIAGTQAALDQLIDARSRAAVAKRPAAGKQVVMYTTQTCPACKVAKQYLAQKGIPYQEIDVQSSRDGMEAFRKLGGNGVPLIMVGEKRMEGFNSQEFEKMLAAG